MEHASQQPNSRASPTGHPPREKCAGGRPRRACWIESAFAQSCLAQEPGVWHNPMWCISSPVEPEGGIAGRILGGA